MPLIHQLSLTIAGITAVDRKAHITTELLPRKAANTPVEEWMHCPLDSCSCTETQPVPSEASPLSHPARWQRALQRMTGWGFTFSLQSPPSTRSQQSRHPEGQRTHQWKNGCIPYLPAALVQRCNPSQAQHRPGHGRTIVQSGSERCRGRLKVLHTYTAPLDPSSPPRFGTQLFKGCATVPSRFLIPARAKSTCLTVGQEPQCEGASTESCCVDSPGSTG